MLLRAFAGQTRAVEPSTLVPPWNRTDADLVGPIVVTAESTLAIPAAYRCVQLIADSIASLPLHAYRGDTKLDTPAVLDQPEAGRTRVETVSTLATSLLMHGNAYAIPTTYDYLQHPTGFVVVDPAAVVVSLNPDGSLTYRVAGRSYDASELYHTRGMTLPGHELGLGPLALHRHTIASTSAGEVYAGEQWTTGSVPAGVISTPDEKTPDEAAAMKQAWMDAHSGRRRSPAVLTGSAKYEPVGFSAADIQMIDSRTFSAQMVCSMFGVPHWLAGVPSSDSKTYQNVTQDSMQFVRYTLRPWLTRIEATLSSMLPRGQRAQFNLDALLRADTKTRYETHAVGISAGFLAVDEARDLEDLEGPAPAPAPAPAPVPPQLDPDSEADTDE